jgi:hypothetical protein
VVIQGREHGRRVLIGPDAVEVLARVQRDDRIAILVERHARRQAAQHVLPDVGQHRGTDADASDRQLPGDPHGDGQPRVLSSDAGRSNAIR